MREEHGISGYRSPESLSKLGIPLLLIFIIIVGSYFLLTKKNTPPPTSETIADNTLIASVGDQKIYYAMIKNATYQPSANRPIDKTVLRKTLNTLIEHAILEKEAANANISLNQTQIQDKAVALVPSLNRNNIPTVFLQNAKYELLKEQIMQKQIRSVTAYSIGYWTPPYSWNAQFTPQERTKYDSQRSDGAKALDEIQKQLLAHKDPAAITQQIITTYPSLTPIIAINGLLYSTLDKSASISARTYAVSSDERTKGFYPMLFSMSVGDVKKYLQKSEVEGTGGTIFEVTSISSGKFATYEDWLADKRNQYVTIYTPI